MPTAYHHQIMLVISTDWSADCRLISVRKDSSYKDHMHVISHISEELLHPIDLIDVYTQLAYVSVHEYEEKRGYTLTGCNNFSDNNSSSSKDIVARSHDVTHNRYKVYYNNTKSWKMGKRVFLENVYSLR